MPPAFALSQDQTLRFISPTQPKGRTGSTNRPLTQHHQQPCPQEHDHPLEASLSTHSSKNTIDQHPKQTNQRQAKVKPRPSIHQPPNHPCHKKTQTSGRRQRIPSIRFTSQRAPRFRETAAGSARRSVRRVLLAQPLHVNAVTAPFRGQPSTRKIGGFPPVLAPAARARPASVRCRTSRGGHALSAFACGMSRQLRMASAGATMPA
jgi:hypothetical protein